MCLQTNTLISTFATSFEVYRQREPNTTEYTISSAKNNATDRRSTTVGPLDKLGITYRESICYTPNGQTIIQSASATVRIHFSRYLSGLAHTVTPSSIDIVHTTTQTRTLSSMSLNLVTNTPVNGNYRNIPNQYNIGIYDLVTLGRHYPLEVPIY